MLSGHALYIVEPQRDTSETQPQTYWLSELWISFRSIPYFYSQHDGLGRMQLKSWFASRAYLFSALFASDRLVMRCFSRLVMGNFASSVGILAKVTPLQPGRRPDFFDFQFVSFGKHSFLKVKRCFLCSKIQKIRLRRTELYEGVIIQRYSV